jgi:hypothetical protein
MAVKYRVSVAFGSAFDCSLIWAKAMSAVTAVIRPARQKKSARI